MHAIRGCAVICHKRSRFCHSPVHFLRRRNESRRGQRIARGRQVSLQLKRPRTENSRAHITKHMGGWLYLCELFDFRTCRRCTSHDMHADHNTNTTKQHTHSTTLYIFILPHSGFRCARVQSGVTVDSIASPTHRTAAAPSTW